MVTATDYPGLGTPGPIGYLVGRGQAFAIIDSVRAARQIPEVGGSNRYALWGYSLGGHAVLSAENWAARYAPELKLVGVAAVAPPTNLVSLLKANTASVEGRVLTSMTVTSWAEKYGLTLGSIIEPGSISSVLAISNSCIDDLQGKLDALAAQEPLAANYLKADAILRQPWSRLLAENSVNGVTGSVPVFIAQGEADSIVLPSVTTSFFRSACQTSAPIEYVSLPLKGHGSSVVEATVPALSWISDRFNGRLAPRNCH